MKPKAMVGVGVMLVVSAAVMGIGGFIWAAGAPHSLGAGAERAEATVLKKDAADSSSDQPAGPAQVAVSLSFTDIKNAKHEVSTKLDECCAGDLKVGDKLAVEYLPDQPGTISCILPKAESLGKVAQVLLAVAGVDGLGGIILLALGMSKLKTEQAASVQVQQQVNN